MKYFQTKESDKAILIFSQDRKRISHTAISYRLGKKAERLIFDSTHSSLKSRRKKKKNTTFSAQKVNFTYLLIKSYV